MRHQRVLRLRKTDYTAGHLLAAATANRHWGGGDSRDEGFAYSFEEGRQGHRHRHRRAHASRHHAPSGGGGHANSSTSPSTGTSRSLRRSPTSARGASYSPTRTIKSRSPGRKGVGGGRGTRSAPRLPSLSDVDDIYGKTGLLGSPNLEQCRLAAGMSARSGGGGGGGGGSGSRASSSRNSALGPGNHEEDGSRQRPSTSGSGSRGGSRQHRKSSPRQRVGKDAFGGGSTGGQRGTDPSVDSLSYFGGSVLGSGDDSPGGGRGGRNSSRRNKGTGGGRGDKGAGSLESGDGAGNDAELDKIFNPLAFLDETQGVRVLIQATKPLEVRSGYDRKG